MGGWAFFGMLVFFIVGYALGRSDLGQAEEQITGVPEEPARPPRKPSRYEGDYPSY